MKVYLASDHGGYKLKEELKRYLLGLDYRVKDMGAHKLDPADDYPDFIVPLAERVAGDSGSVGIVLGRSGNGEAMAANKVKGVRAALCLSKLAARKAREHNDANVLSLGADYIDTKMAKNIVKVFLETAFSGEERHKRRIEKIKKSEC
jgi:ribose 5-phosphate isomerase B